MVSYLWGISVIDEPQLHRLIAQRDCQINVLPWSVVLDDINEIDISGIIPYPVDTNKLHSAISVG